MLVEMLLLRDRFEEAWHAGTEFGCSERLRLTVARERAADHPLDSIELYEAQAFRLIETKDPTLYERRLDHLRLP